MSAPNYSPTSGKGTTYTDEYGNSYVFDGTFWQQMSSGGGGSVQGVSSTAWKNPKPVATTTVTNNTSTSGGVPYDEYRRRGWNNTAAMEADWNAGGGGVGGRSNYETSTGGGDFNFDFEAEVDKAYQELGSYYDQLLQWSQGDLNLALSRLKEDYETGKRFRMEDFNLSEQALDVAQEQFSKNADEAYRTLATRQLSRGISRESAFGAPGKGIADVEQQRLTQDVNLGQQNIDLQEQSLQTNKAQSDKLADVEFQRQNIDLPEQFEREKVLREEERKQKSGELALSRAQRAYQRFESNLV